MMPRKIGCAFSVGDVACSLSPINHSNTSQSWLSVSSCVQKGRITLPSEYTALLFDAEWAAVQKDAFGWFHVPRMKHILPSDEAYITPLLETLDDDWIGEKIRGKCPQQRVVSWCTEWLRHRCKMNRKGFIKELQQKNNKDILHATLRWSTKQKSYSWKKLESPTALREHACSELGNTRGPGR